MSQHYDTVQKELRQHLKTLLKRRPASISHEDYERLFADVKNKDRKRLHFFTEAEGRLIWKPNVTVKELQELSAANLPQILSAFTTSHSAKNRTEFSFLAPANRKEMIRDYTHPDGHCYGFDILIRRPTSSIEADGASDRNLSIGDLSFALVIHVALTDDCLPADNAEIRAVWGESLKLCRLWENLRGRLGSLESEINRLLQIRDYSTLTKACVTTANASASFSFPV